eukprot:CCRYP_012341-RC/>CCRYP_012341-RC protein AED:0.07 eAED:0.07 QI:286/1/1/1/0.83/0.85/7/369/700
MRNRTTASPLPTRISGISSTSKAVSISTTTWIILIVFSSCISFYVGVWSAWSISSASGTLNEAVDLCLEAASGEGKGDLGRKVRDIFKARLERELKMNCHSVRNDNETAECPKVCFDAPNCDAELGRKLGDVFRWKIDEALLETTKCPKVVDCAKFCMDAANGRGDRDLGQQLDGILNAKIKAALDAEKFPEVKQEPSSKKPRFGSHLNHFASGLVSISRKDLFNAYDFGVPMSSNAEIEDTLIFYQAAAALPSNATVNSAASYGGDIPHVNNALDATENCDQMNVLFIKTPNTLRQCTALVGGQYQGYHVQRWMRVVGEGEKGKSDPKAPLHHVSRTTVSGGYDELNMPKQSHLDLHREILAIYLENLKDMQNELKSTLQRIAVDNTVVVMTVNKGQIELLMNFVCSARSIGLDLKNVLLFPTDQFSKDIADGLGLATFYNDKLMKPLPSEEAKSYGDSTFGLMMMAKVISVQLVNELGYDLLFQDVDVVWYKDPVNYFRTLGPPLENFDVYFQDDGSRQERYAPYSANSGFYFVRSNDRTQLLFRRMLYAGDLIFACGAHQQVLIFLLSDMNSLGGLKVKVFSRDGDDFPGGYHYHMRKDWMKQMVENIHKPYIFHMSWTLNKDNKLEFMKQMGMWYLHGTCIGSEAKEIVSGSNANDVMINKCCSIEPLTKCYYRDKPSVIPCKDSPPKDNGGVSFW